MIGLADPSKPLDRSLLEAPGGFAWWYFDLVDGDGNGLVAIWSFGLPFLPGREAAWRAGEPIEPSKQPSLNLAVYRNWTTELYTLSCFEPEDAVWQPGTEFVRLGRSTLDTRTVAGRRQVDMQLDVDVAGGRTLRGTLSVEGPAVRPAGRAAPDASHQWVPLLVGVEAEARLEVDGRSLAPIRGRLYHDRNGSDRALSDLGIRDWLWGRHAFEDAERIHYLLWPDDPAAPPVAWGFEVDPRGRLTDVGPLDVTRVSPRIGRFGMPWHREVELGTAAGPWLTVRQQAVVDDGFFYLRFLSQAATPDGRQAPGVGEAILPARVDAGWSRPLVRMAVQPPPGQRPSPFLPLFAGLRRPQWEVA